MVGAVLGDPPPLPAVDDSGEADVTRPIDVSGDRIPCEMSSK
jgi:hypothetical protein